MRRLHLGENVAVFLVFFGIALIESTQSGHWPAVAFWLVVGALSLRADNLRRGKHS